LGLVGLALLGSGVGKIVGAEEAGKLFGGPNRPYLLAVIEFIVLALLTIPRTRLLGIILSASYFGGAIAFSWLAENEAPLPSVIISIALYVAAVLLYPRLTDGSKSSPAV
ncbi:MAG: hypothetical protein AAFZ52_20130, partial [Bacteroidota bacterium]